jgi:translocation and assembly module TamA
VSAQVRPGAVYTIDRIVPAPLSGLDPRIFDRYQAFDIGERFDMRLLALTAERTLADSLFLSASYKVDCSTAGMSIRQNVAAGKPRSISIGVGADTEGYAVVIAQWKHSRIGASASDAEVYLRDSYLVQEAEGSMHLYPGPDTRFFIMPQTLLESLNELRYSAIISDFALSPGTSRDLWSGRLDTHAGPALNYVHMLSGLGPTSDTYLSFDTVSSWQTHLFEYYAANPREGWRTALETSSRFQDLQSYVSADRVKLSGQRLWNLGAYEPPALVLGTRGYAATTYTNNPAQADEQLSPQWRYFVGGDDDLRGAERQQIPTDDGGFLTAVYDGLELRMGDVLPYGLQPFVFVDGAMMGRLYFHLDPDVYWSPGWGLRWALPVGSIRTTIAHGFLWHRDQTAPPLYDPHWQFYFSFGREF